MDTKIFFHYPDDPQEPAASPGFLEDATSREWSTLLGYAQARHLRRGETLYDEGQHDAALYVLTIGRIELHSSRSAPVMLEPPATLGEIAFIDGGISLERATAATDSELLRISQDTFEALSTREPVLAQRIVLDVARRLARTLRPPPAGT